MQYLLLIYEDEKQWTNPNPADFAATLGAYRAFGQEYATAIQGGNALQPTGTAKTVRMGNGSPMVTDGPFAETKEQLGGYYLVEADTPEAAVTMAAKIPGARTGCVEVRPIQKFS
jgi:hypothetical protein